MLTFNIDRRTRKRPETTHPRSASLPDGRDALLRNILETRELRKILGNLIPEIITVWAGRSRPKLLIAATINRILQVGFFQPGAGKYASLTDDKDFFRESEPLAALMAEVTDKLTDACCTGLESMFPDEKMVLMQGVISGLFNGRSGTIITQMASVLNEIHDHNPEFLANVLNPGIRNWIEKTDFGELKEFAGKSSVDFKAIIRAINDNLWQYPGKVLLLLSLLPEAANMLSGGLKDTVSRFNDISPDLLADTTLTLLGEINGEELGKGINEFTELIRKLATGSALIGDPGFPKMPKDVSKLFNTVLTTLDTDKFLEASSILAQQKLIAKQCILDDLKDRPEILLKKITQYPNLKNTLLQAVCHHLIILEELPGDAVTKSITNGIAALDTDTLAEIINLTAVLMNRIHDFQPEAIPNVVSKVIDGLDLDLIAETSNELIEDVLPDLLPLGRALLPRLIHGFCDALESQEDAYATDLAKARQRLWRLLSAKEE